MFRITALLVLVFVGPAYALAQGLDQRVAVRPGGLLQVDLELGEEVRQERVSLEVRSHDADEVWAVADLSGLGATSVKFRVDDDDGETVRVYGRADGVMSWLFGGPGVRVRVWVPRSFDLDLRCTSGPIRVEDVRGAVRARTTDAAIELESVEGDVHLRTRNGGVTLREVRGDVEAKITTAGDIDMRWVEGRVSARTGVGDVRLQNVTGDVVLRTEQGGIELRELAGRAEAKTEQGELYASFVDAPSGVLETRRGSVEVVVPGAEGAALEARTGRGSVDVDPGLAHPNARKNGSEFVGQLNGGGEELRVYTARGMIRVGKR